MISDSDTVRRRLERITGLLLRVQPEHLKLWRIRGWKGSEQGEPCVDVVGPGLKQAQEEFLRQNLRRVAQIKLEEQSGLCLLCGKGGGLDPDHYPIPKARGRNDRPENIRMIHRGEHDKRHGVPQLKWAGTVQ